MAKNYYYRFHCSKIILLLFSLYMVGCATSSKDEFAFNSMLKSEQEKFFKHELKLNINNKEYNGIGIIPPAPSYKIKIKDAKGKLDLIRISTCAGEETKENAGWSEEFTVGLSKEIEGADSCIFRVAAYEKDKGRHSWFMADFSDPNETLPYKMLCNGWPVTFVGVGICESVSGAYQILDFPVDVKIFGDNKGNPDCNFWEYQNQYDEQGNIIKSGTEGKHWEFRLPYKECVYTFTEMNPPFRGGRLTTSGYDEILIRGE